MRAAVLDAVRGADIFIATAAVADWRVASYSQHKIKKVSRPMAERYGLANVRWRPAGQGPEFVAPPIEVKKFNGS